MLELCSESSRLNHGYRTLKILLVLYFSPFLKDYVATVGNQKKMPALLVDLQLRCEGILIRRTFAHGGYF